MRNSDLPRHLWHEMEGEPPPDDYVGNGCTCAPNRIGGADLRPACHFHDYAYDQGGDEADRLLADATFYRNLLRCGVTQAWANVYYRRVRLHGIRAFQYRDPPRGWRLLGLYVWCFVARYISWGQD